MNPREAEFYVGRAVTSLQTMLRTIAQAVPELPTVVPDGVYGEQTKAAVIAFQRRYGLPQTGVADYDTWRAIRNAYRTALVEVSPAAPLNIVMDGAITEGSDNLHVGLIQAMLHAIHAVLPNVPDCPMNCVCDSGTVQAIRALQRCCNLPCSGIVDKQTWQMLTGLYHQAVGNGEIDG